MADLNTQVSELEKEDNGISIQAENLKTIKDGCILHMTGYIDTFNSIFVQVQGKRLIDYGYKKLIFDFSGLRYISSTGIGTFAEFMRILDGNGGKFVIANANAKIMDVFNLLGFGKLFTFADSVESAKSLLVGEQVSTTRPFPKIVACSVCHKKFRVPRAGRYYCPGCRRILAVR